MLTELTAKFKKASSFKDVSVLRNAWLLHFTNEHDAKRIVEEGFTKGTSLSGQLVYCFGSKSDVPGVNFAFAARDEYAIMSMSEYDFGFSVESALMFRGDAVRMLHYDGFYQCGFWGPSISSPIHILLPKSETDVEEEPHVRQWKLEGSDREGDLFEVMSSLEAQYPVAKPRRLSP